MILTGRLGTKTPVVNTKWPWHLRIWPSVDPLINVYCSYLYGWRELSKKECFYKPFKRTSRKTMVSNTCTKNKEVCDHHARHRLGTYKCMLYTNLLLEGKAGSFNAT